MTVPAAGRKKLTEKDPTLLRDLESPVEPVTRGDPMSPLRETRKGVRNLSAEFGAHFGDRGRPFRVIGAKRFAQWWSERSE